MSNIWLTSDYHANHAKIIIYCSRPFANAEEMNEAMITYHNELVSPNDTTYCLGDVGWGNVESFVRQLNGKKILILGNHDHRDDYHKYFDKVCHYNEIKTEGKLVVCSHYAMRVWNKSHQGSFHCYAHSHGTLHGVGRSMDVGVDTNNFRPYNIDEIIQKLSAVPIMSFDGKVVAEES